MKNLLLAGLVLTTTLSFSQQAKIKIKLEQLKFRYVYIPEITGYDDYNTFSASIVDLDKNIFTVVKSGASDGNNIVIGIDHFHSLNLSNNGNYKIEINRLTHTTSNEELVVTDEIISNADGSSKTVQKYAYAVPYSDKYLIEIKNKIGELIFQKDIDVSGVTMFPQAYTNGNAFGSEKQLVNTYKAFQTENPKNFEQKEKSASITHAFNNEIKSLLRSKISRELETIVIPILTLKTKDVRFSILDSAQVYFDQGISALQKDFNTATTINFHTEDAIKNFSNAVRIYEIYLGTEFLSIIPSDEKESYEYGLKVNLFYASLLSSDFEKAGRIYEEIAGGVIGERNEANSSNEDNNGKSKSISGGLGAAMSEFKRTEKEKAVDHMAILLPVLLHEILNYEKHKGYYNYAKL